MTPPVPPFNHAFPPNEDQVERLANHLIDSLNIYARLECPKIHTVLCAISRFHAAVANENADTFGEQAAASTEEWFRQSIVSMFQADFAAAERSTMP